jgi:hypothetical protein
MQAIAIRTRIPASRKIRLTLPRSIPAGETDLIVVVGEHKPRIGTLKKATGRQIRRSRIFGLWKKKKGMKDELSLIKHIAP